jgi:hypothetical protein
VVAIAAISIFLMWCVSCVTLRRGAAGRPPRDAQAGWSELPRCAGPAWPEAPDRLLAVVIAQLATIRL